MAQHHFIPQTYLRGFAADDDPARIYFYDRRIVGKTVTKRLIKDVCSQSDLYKLLMQDGTVSAGLEEVFATITEPIFKELTDKLLQQKPLSDREKSELAACLATQMIRTPASREIYNAMSAAVIDREAKKMWAKLLDDEERAKAFAEMKRETGVDASAITKEDVQGILDGTKFKLKSEAHKESWLKHNVEQMPAIFRALEQMHWRVYFAPTGTAFITSDNPVGILVKKLDGYYAGSGILSAGALRFFPLAKSACLCMMDDEASGFSFVAADKRKVRQINSITAVSHHNILLGHNAQLVSRSIRRSKGLNMIEMIKRETVKQVMGENR